MNLPALCAELRIRPDGEVPVVNSRDVAEFFEKRHDNVLRDIEAILASSDLRGRDWFREVEYIDEQGKPRRSFDLTRQGFTLLVMGWSGVRALKFKTQYIQAFDEMEHALKQRVAGTDIANLIVSGLKEAIAPLAVRFDGQDRAIERIERRQEDQGQRLVNVEATLKNVLRFRRKISPTVKAEHVDAEKRLGSRCPVYPEILVLDDDGRPLSAEFDHFYTNQHADAAHTWLISKKAHDDITNGRISRDEAAKFFAAYQAQRRRLPGRQPSLF